ncbi:hypothetical protein EUX98_g4050 [Antrodiella citrinella]|uniref:Uncharacterized protein n=1 Tax=Antrodiella citrinella TaxID=2447956 RepID=A0A4V3XIR0_9APHY|nr:hypothetical protein EUX98_g4050 [Antrodiella citrinella]
MAETKTRHPHSQIPVKASSSRYAQSALPSSLPPPHFSFVSPSQHLSVSDSPTYTNVSAANPPNAPTGLSSFRSFRNLLPFGPNKPSNPSPGPSANKSGTFSNLGAIRRSMNGERSVSAPVLRSKKSQEDPPVLSIEFSHKVDEPFIKPEDLRGGLGLYMKQPEPPPPQSAPATSQRFQQATASIPSPQMIAISDLSTIMESDTSGISKHSPNIEDSGDRRRREDRPQVDSHQRHTDARDLSPHGFRQSSLIPPPTKHDRLPTPTPSSQDTSALDLSTSKVTNEVLEALANDHQQGWSHGIVIDDMDAADAPDDPDASFNLGSLDPELAALLSPNRIKSLDNGISHRLSLHPASGKTLTLTLKLALDLWKCFSRAHVQVCDLTIVSRAATRPAGIYKRIRRATSFVSSFSIIIYPAPVPSSIPHPSQ